MDTAKPHRPDRPRRPHPGRTAGQGTRRLAAVALLLTGTGLAACSAEPTPAPDTSVTVIDAAGDASAGPAAGSTPATGGAGGPAEAASSGQPSVTEADAAAPSREASDPESFENHPEAAVHQGPVGPEVLEDPELCTAGPGKTITLLEDPVIPEQVIPAAANPDGAIDGVTVPGPATGAITLPARVGEAGCTVEFAAPGGCLGAVAISPSSIPESVLPERVIPETVLPDGTVLPAVPLPAVSAPPERMEGAFQEQVCRQDPDQGEPGSATYVPAIYRDPVYRDPVYQDPLYQDAVHRDGVHRDDGSVPPATAPGATARGMVVAGATVAGAALAGYVIEGTDVDVLEAEDSGKVAYVSPGDVLFAPDEDTIAADAEADLEAVVEEIRAAHGGSLETVRLRVEGHTDDVRSAEHNQALSERRAEAVGDWLADHAGLDPARITTEGLGLTAPRADNDTEEGRALNRRVVITVDPDPAG